MILSQNSFFCSRVRRHGHQRDIYEPGRNTHGIVYDNSSGSSRSSSGGGVGGGGGTPALARWQSRQIRTFREVQANYSSHGNQDVSPSVLIRPIIVISDCETCGSREQGHKSRDAAINRPDIIESSLCRNNRRSSRMPIPRDEEEEYPFTIGRQINRKVDKIPMSATMLKRYSMVSNTCMSNAHSRDNPGAPSESALLARRKVIRLLIAVIVSFALCALPYHIRILWQLWGDPQVSFGELLLPPITFVIFYFSSALNPVLYAFLSLNFRVAMKGFLTCGLAYFLKRKRNKLFRRHSTQYSGNPSC